MPVYHFEVHDGVVGTTTTGEELANDEKAWTEAIIFAGEVLKDIDGRLRPGDGWELRVTDRDRTPVFLIEISTKKLR
jgi:hypothetical protein